MDSALVPMSPSTTPMSTTVVKLDRGSHEFKIIGYSNSHGIGIGKFITSEIFTVGGHHWCLRYYPDGYGNDDGGEYVAIFIVSVDTTCNVKALFDIRLLDAVSGALSTDSPIEVKPHVFGPSDSWGFNQFMCKNDLEASKFLHDDCITIRCNLIVIKDLPDDADCLANASNNEPE